MEDDSILVFSDGVANCVLVSGDGVAVFRCWCRVLFFGDVDAEFRSLGMLVESSCLWGCWCRVLVFGDVDTEFCSLGMLTLSSILWRCGRRLYSGV